MTFRNHDKGCFDENKNFNMRKGPRDALLPSFMEILIEIQTPKRENAFITFSHYSTNPFSTEIRNKDRKEIFAISIKVVKNSKPFNDCDE